MASALRLSLRVAGTNDGVRRALDALDGFLARHAIPADAAWPINVALDEVLSNIVRHGVAASGVARAENSGAGLHVESSDAGLQARERACDIDISFLLDHGEIEVRVLDDAAAYDPLSAPPPDTRAPLATRRMGGLGVHLVRKLMDRVEYTREGNRNCLVFRRRIAG